MHLICHSVVTNTTECLAYPTEKVPVVEDRDPFWVINASLNNMKEGCIYKIKLLQVALRLPPEKLTLID